MLSVHATPWKAYIGTSTVHGRDPSFPVDTYNANGALTPVRTVLSTRQAVDKDFPALLTLNSYLLQLQLCWLCHQ